MTEKKEDKTQLLDITDSHGEVINQYNKEMLQTITNTVAKNATKSELIYFLTLASNYNLDPFAKEIWFVKVKTGDTMIMTSRDGYLKIASEKPNFLKVQSYAVYENDDFHTTIKNGEVVEVNHSFGLDRGKIIGAYAFLKTVDGKQDMYAYKELKQYNKKNSVWNHYTEAMIRKVAEVDVLKRFAKIRGLVTSEEMGYKNPNDEYQYTQPEKVIDEIKEPEQEPITVTVEDETVESVNNEIVEENIKEE